MITKLLVGFLGMTVGIQSFVAGILVSDGPRPDLMSEIIENTSLATNIPPKEIYQVWVTAYSSTPEETDDTPFITATGSQVRDGIAAANFLPFGTKIKIPEIFEDKVFVIEDRMHERKKNYVDIWMPTKEDALRQGINYTEIVVVN